MPYPRPLSSEEIKSFNQEMLKLWEYCNIEPLPEEDQAHLDRIREARND